MYIDFITKLRAHCTELNPIFGGINLVVIPTNIDF